CIIPALTDAKCTLSNFTLLSECLCLNIHTESWISECVLNNCTYKELVLVETAQHELCIDQPRPSRRPNLYGAAITLSVIVICFVALRVWSRWSITRQFWWDDWVLLVATVSGTWLGFGWHVWNVDPRRNIVLYQFQWIYEILYVWVQTFSKIAILMFYLRIFPQTWFRRTCICFIVAMLLHGFGFFLPIIFQCTPVALAYNKALHGKCLNLHAIALVGAICSIVEDLVIIALPISCILQLRMRREKKVGVVFMFLVGFIACLASMMRLSVVVHFYYSIDQNLMWSMVELALSIMCICFPAIKLLL
ncbi:hypothetical protein BGZ60DRAFT_332854, partial [Tricladium varicosporioides]